MVLIKQYLEIGCCRHPASRYPCFWNCWVSCPVLVLLDRLKRAVFLQLGVGCLWDKSGGDKNLQVMQDAARLAAHSWFRSSGRNIIISKRRKKVVEVFRKLMSFLAYRRN